MVWLSRSKNSKHLVGKSFEEIAKITGKDPWEAAFDIAIAEGDDFVDMRVRGASETEDDIINILLSPLTSLSSDGALHAPYAPLRDFACPDVNSYGTYARFFRVYAASRDASPWKRPVRKSSSIAAARLGIMDRGICGRECGRTSPSSTTEDHRQGDVRGPMRSSAGIQYILVNGETVLRRANTRRRESPARARISEGCVRAKISRFRRYSNEKGVR